MSVSSGIIRTPFRSSNYIFRPTALGERLRDLGLVNNLQLVRESKVTCSGSTVNLHTPGSRSA